jgi:hypothetical protein
LAWCSRSIAINDLTGNNKDELAENNAIFGCCSQEQMQVHHLVCLTVSAAAEAVKQCTVKCSRRTIPFPDQDLYAEGVKQCAVKRSFDNAASAVISRS